MRTSSAPGEHDVRLPSGWWWSGYDRAVTDFLLIDPRVRDLSPMALDERGALKVLPTSFWETTTPRERALFGHRHGFYLLPTVELVEHLHELIGGRSAIEIGSGNGVLAQALGIPATDNCMQRRSHYRRIYEATGQPTVTYGRNVTPLSAADAVRRHKPDVVVAAWVTHRYRQDRHWAGGNEIGVDEEDVIAHCSTYVVIGNEHVHRTKSIWDLPHTITYPPFVVSRAANGSRDFIAVFTKAAS